MAIAHCFSPSIPTKPRAFISCGILRVSYKMKEPGAFAIMQKPFAFEFPASRAIVK